MTKQAEQDIDRAAGTKHGVANREISMMGAINIASAAWVLGIPVSTLRNDPRAWEPNSDGTYNVRRLMEIRCAQWRTDDPEEAAKVKMVVEKARIHELKRMELEARLVDISILQDQLRDIVRHLRNAGESLMMLYGQEAADILAVALDDCERTIESIAPPDQQLSTLADSRVAADSAEELA